MNSLSSVIVLCRVPLLLLFCCFGSALSSTWSEWWTYDGISGPDFWGLVNPEWSLCSKGKRQSPINIDPQQLLFDPHLKHLRVDKHKIQLLAYNSDLYGNMSQAVSSSNGLAMIALLGQVSDTPNLEFDVIAQHLKMVRYKGNHVHIRHLSISGLMPHTDDYVTYDGSLTQPGCQETVTWVILNKPIYISNEHLMSLRDVMQGDEINPKVPMENNCRIQMPIHSRPIRTNINFHPPTKDCTMVKQVNYQAATILDKS